MGVEMFLSNKKNQFIINLKDNEGEKRNHRKLENQKENIEETVASHDNDHGD